MTVPTEKLHKALARCGLGSRRALEQLIAEGQVTLNGRVARLGDRVTASDKVTLAGRPVTIRPPVKQQTRLLIYHKPEGEICTRSDPEGRPTVFSNLPKLPYGRWIAVGRLDLNSSGLMLFTNEGELANRLMHPSTAIDREYLVRVFGELPEGVRERLLTGVQLEDGPARFTDLGDGGGQGINRWFYVTVMEGRNRLVRRMWESQGIRVSRLKRVRFGPIFLPSAVKQGRYQELERPQIEALCRYANIPLPADFVADEATAERTRKPAGRGRGMVGRERTDAPAAPRFGASLRRSPRSRTADETRETAPARGRGSASSPAAAAQRAAERPPRRRTPDDALSNRPQTARKQPARRPAGGKSAPTRPRR
ncbi:MAG: pseudouridine synthase [Pseudomonadales bacterium]|nr:pseudouridine synthase [Pseudomonadales bacterium]MCC6529100.1 pseudouridine synthase [Pseudomonadales bacterium]MCP5333995.1 pseudouridine synthase [Pseudomonadales bacterium]HMU90571.1 pseudouridine synthase [Pseudomonadales bacterium]HMW14087.1 pseudouridine synthase [Pseudomonadales bacterium]